MWIEKKDENEIKQPTQTNAPTVGSGGGATEGVSATPTTGNFSTMSPIQTQQPTQKWATAQDYLKANQPQATQLGQKVESSLTGTLGQQKSAIDTAAQTAQKQIESGITAFNPEIAKTAVETPTEITSSPQKLQDFLGQWNAAYKGPSSFETSESYTPAVEAATKATEIGENIKTPGGRTQLLQNQFGVYGAGNQALDTSLLGTAENYGNIQQLAPQFTGLQDYLGQKSAGLSTAAQGAQTTTQATQDQARAALAGNLTKFQQDLATKLDTTKADAAAKTQQYQTDLASGNVDKVANDLRAAGISEEQIKPIIDNLTILNTQYQYNPNLGAGYNYNPETAITTQNVATPEDYAKAQAWQQLTGEQGYTSVLSPEQASQAGQITAPETGFIPDYLKQQTGTLVKQKDDYLLNNTAAKLSDYIPQEDLDTASQANASDAKTKTIELLTPTIKTYIDVAARQGVKNSMVYNDPKTYPAGLKALLESTPDALKIPFLNTVKKQLG